MSNTIPVVSATILKALYATCAELTSLSQCLLFTILKLPFQATHNKLNPLEHTTNAKHMLLVEFASTSPMINFPARNYHHYMLPQQKYSFVLWFQGLINSIHQHIKGIQWIMYCMELVSVAILVLHVKGIVWMSGPLQLISDYYYVCRFGWGIDTTCC